MKKTIAEAERSLREVEFLWIAERRPRIQSATTMDSGSGLRVTTKRATVGIETAMNFAWDEAKNRKNIAKHGLSFEDAEQVFSGPCVTFEDDRFDYGEERLITLGLLAGRPVIIAHSPRDEGTRIISIRKANRHEQKIYQERLGPN